MAASAFSASAARRARRLRAEARLRFSLVRDGATLAGHRGGPVPLRPASEGRGSAEDLRDEVALLRDEVRLLSACLRGCWEPLPPEPALVSSCTPPSAPSLSSPPSQCGDIEADFEAAGENGYYTPLHPTWAAGDWSVMQVLHENLHRAVSACPVCHHIDPDERYEALCAQCHASGRAPLSYWHEIQTMAARRV